MNRIFIRSAGLVPVGEHWEKGLADLMYEAASNALLAVPDVKPDKIIVGNMFSGYAEHQEQLGSLLASALGMAGVSAIKVEAACGSGGVAVHEGYLSIKSGEYENVLVVGVEKMKDMGTGKATKALSMAESAEYTQVAGASFISLNALLSKVYMAHYGRKDEEMASFPVIAHRNGVTAAHAQFRKEITVKDVLSSAIIADPIRLLSSPPAGDGAAAVLLSSKGGDVEVLASEVATNQFIFQERENLLDFMASRIASSRALAKAGIDVSMIDFMEVHDAFPVVAALALESMGISKPGMAPIDAMNGRFNCDGELPIGTFGGLKARGHPVGATGAYQVAEAYLQLSGGAGKNQIGGAKIGLTHNVGGIDSTCAVHVLRSAI